MRTCSERSVAKRRPIVRYFSRRSFPSPFVEFAKRLVNAFLDLPTASSGVSIELSASCKINRVEPVRPLNHDHRRSGFIVRGAQASLEHFTSFLHLQVARKLEGIETSPLLNLIVYRWTGSI